MRVARRALVPMLLVALTLTPAPVPATPSATAPATTPDSELIASAPWHGPRTLTRKRKKKRAGYVTPGYKPKRKKARTSPVPAPTRPLIPLAESAKDPRVLLDAAGTAHITWVEKGPADSPADIEVYCRLPRGAQACDAVHRWPEVYLPKIAVSSSGLMPLALDEDLVLVSSRYPYDGVPIPRRPPANTPDYEDATATVLDLSVDGGTSFAPRAWIGDLWVRDAAVFGPTDSPSIIGITDTVTGGTSTQTYRSGRSEVRSALLGPGDQAYGGRVVDEGGVPLAAWSDNSGDGYLGRWSGNGDVNDASTWQRNPIGPASEPSLTSGRAGTFLVSKPGLSGTPQIRRVDGVTAGPPVPLEPGDFATVRQDGGGVLVGSLVPGLRNVFRVQRGDGSTFGQAVPVATAPEGQGFGDHRFDVAPDGGGVAVLEVFSGSTYNPLVATSFGSLKPTGTTGLGGRPGEGLVGPEPVVECGRITFGAVEMRTEQGCFFNATRKAAAAGLSAAGGLRVALGPVDLNGLWLRPESGVQIQIDPARKTIDTTGPIRVELDAAGGPITLWRGELHLKLPKPQEKTVLASFDTSQFAAALKGFPISGRIDVELTDKGVRIPVNLKLPKAFGGAKGEGVLRAAVGGGLQLDTLRIEINEAYLAGPTLRNAVLQYTAGDDTWSGEAELLMPPGRGSLGFKAKVRFTGGSFREAAAEVTIPYPGLPLFEGVYLYKVRGGFGVDPTKISVGGTVGVIQTAVGETFLVNSRADATVTFGSPWSAEVTGSSTLLDLIPVQNMRMLVSGDGFVLYRGSASLKLGSRDGGVGLASGLSLGFDLDEGQFSGRFQGGKVTLFFPDPFPDPSLNVSDVVLSSRGIGLCQGGGGFRYAYAGRDLTIFPPLGNCNLGPIEIALGRQQAKALQARRAASSGRLAAAATVRLSRSRHAYLYIDGDGAAPGVSLVDPAGKPIEPVRPASQAQAKAERVVALTAGTQTIISIRNPRKGGWQVVPAQGSAAITGIKKVESQPSPRLKSRIVRTKGSFTLRYRLRGGTELGAIVSEQTRKGTSRVVGEIKQGKGTLRIPAGGPKGRRTLTAVLTRDDLPVESVPAGRYTAPAPPRPGKVRKVRIKRVGAGVRIRWRRSANVDGYAVVVRSGDGLARRITVGAKKRSVLVKGIDRDDRATATVQGLSSSGGLGGPGRAKLAAPKAKKKRR